MLYFTESGDTLNNVFSADTVIVAKKTKNGRQDQNIIPMIRSIEIQQGGDNVLVIDAVICCQNPTLNPAQIVTAIDEYLPDLKPDFSKYCRVALYDSNNQLFR